MNNFCQNFKTKQIYILLFFLLSVSNSFSQNNTVIWYNADNGLPQNSIKDIVKDKYGFLWMSTDNGLVRYDGRSFQTFDDLKMKNSHLTAFRGDIMQDSIFVYSGYYEDALFINKRKVRKTDVYQNTYHRDKQTYIELVKPPYIFGGVNKNFQYHFSSSKIRFFANIDSLWFFDKNSKSTTIKHLGRSLNSIDLDNIIIHRGEIFYIDKFNQKSYIIQGETLIEIDSEQDLFEKNNKYFWHKLNDQSFVISDDSIYNLIYDGNTLRLQFLFSISEKMKKNIATLYLDTDYDRVYIGSLTKGFGIVNLSTFKVAKTNNGNLEDVYYGHLPIDSAQVLTSTGKVFQADGLIEDYRFSRIIDKHSIIDAKNNSYWIKNDDIIYQITRDSFQHLSITDSVDYDKRITNIFDTGQQAVAAVEDDLWLGQSQNNKGEMYFFEGYDLKTITEKYVFNKTVRSLILLPDSVALVGCRMGLYKLDRKTRKQTHILGSEQLNIRNISQTSTGSIWITTSGDGLYLFKNDKLIKMPLDDKLALQNPHCILEDKSHYLWITTNNGLFKVAESVLLSYAEDPNTKVYYYGYFKANGLSTNEFNGGCDPCGNKLDNGQFTFPSLDGIVFFNPEIIKAHYPINSLFIERATIDDKKEIYFRDFIELENNFYRAHINIDVPFYASDHNLYIESFLEGKNNSWERLDNNRRYTITNLEHGSYKLKFRVLTSPYTAYEYKEITIKVKPLFYQTWIFKLLLILFLISLIVFLYKLRVKYLIRSNKRMAIRIANSTKDLRASLDEQKVLKSNLKQEAQQLKKLLSIIGHDIATPLKYLTFLANEVVKMSPNEYEKSKTLVHSMKKSSEELFNFTNALKEYANLYGDNKKEKFDLNQIIVEKIKLYEEISKSKNIQFVNNIKPETKLNSSKNIVKVVIHNLIDNAVKYSEKGEIAFQFHETELYYKIEIKDNGVGIKTDLVDYYMQLQDTKNPDKLLLQKFNIGLHLVIQLLGLIQGKINFKKNKPQGTIVHISLKK